MRILHLGELTFGLVELLTRARELKALNLEEEHEQLGGLVSIVEKTFTLQGREAETQREVVWNWASELLLVVQRRLAEQHVLLGLQDARRALESNRAEARRVFPRSTRS